MANEEVEQIWDGKVNWFTEDTIIYCCDCGLGHKWRMGIGYRDGKPTIWYRVWVLNKETKRYRLGEKIYVDEKNRIKRKSCRANGNRTK